MTEKKEIKKFKREISAGFIIFRRTSEGLKFLVLYHGHNYWNFPKGKIESEEKSLAAAFRETKEEAGLGKQDLRVLERFKVYQKFSFRRGRYHGRSRSAGAQQKEELQNIFKIVIFYLAETKNPVIKISHEHQGYAWLSFGEGMKIMNRYRGNQKILKEAYDFIRHESSRRREENTARQNRNI
ncbi:MAG: NUDIX domain-containing protein [Candidatus Liptonbacteria bacterium]|nr:NUDIX domain-containing protein [Candidatus Liptonbacteria bacterium]